MQERVNATTKGLQHFSYRIYGTFLTNRTDDNRNQCNSRTDNNTCIVPHELARDTPNKKL
jgi:hypothetical protein